MPSASSPPSLDDPRGAPRTRHTGPVAGLALCWLLLSTFAATAAAAESPLRFDEPEAVLRGTIEAGATSPSVTLRLMPAGSEPVVLLGILRPTLNRVGGGDPIDASRIKTDATFPTTITAQKPVEMLLSVELPKASGVYRGSLRFLLQGGASVDLPVRMEARQALRPLLVDPASVGLETVACDRLTCWLVATASLVTPTEGAVLVARLENPNDEDVTLESNVGLFVSGVAGHRGTRENELSVSLSSNTIPARGVATVQLRLGPETLRPDRYEGKLIVRPAAAPGKLVLAPTAVPLHLNVRAGPVLPLMLIAAGVLLGLLSRVTSTPERQRQRALWESYERLKDRIRSELTDDDVRTELLAQLDRAAKEIDEQTETYDAVQARLQSIDSQRSLLVQLESYRTFAAENDDARARFLAVRKAVLIADFETARTELKALAAAYHEKLKVGGLREGTEPTVFLRAVERSIKIAEAGAAHLRRSTSTSKTARGRRFFRFLGGLASGSARFRGRDLSAIAAVFGVLLLVLLVLLGFQTLYLGQSAATFGAGGLFDYLPLFLWGFSAEVAQRTFQNLWIKTN